MKLVCLVSAVIMITAVTPLPCSAADGTVPQTRHLSVSEQGRIIAGSPPYLIASPNGRMQLKYTPVAFTGEIPLNRIDVFSGDCAVETRTGIPGNGFLIADSGTFVAIERPDTNAVPGRVTMYTPDNRSQRFDFHAICSPAFSADQQSLVIPNRDGTAVIDMASFRLELLPEYDSIAAYSSGLIAGLDGSGPMRIDWWQNGNRMFSRTIDFIPRDMVFCGSKQELWILGSDRIIRIGPSGDIRCVADAGAGEEWMDLHALESVMVVGGRMKEAGVSRGFLNIFSANGQILSRRQGPEELFHANAFPDLHQRDDAIPWPFLPNEQHSVGNSYGAYQGFDPYFPYMHPGIDILVPFGSPVYAVRDGVVKAILTTSADLHWRVAVGDEETSALCPGYLYAHLVQSSIAVSVGDHVIAGQYLGNIVEWVTDFHHLHFARIEASGTTWSGSWRNTLNPHLLLENRTESDPPIFLDARPGARFAFCTNDTGNYQDPSVLHGAVDIIACVYDRVLTAYESAVQELWYMIYPAGDPGHPVVDNTLAVRFNMELDVYQSSTYSDFLVDLLYKQDSVCRTWFDYDYRIFYHIITNSNGDDIYDADDVVQSWDTALLPDGDYVIEVTAYDANFNSVTAGMTVTTANGNPPEPTPTPTATQPPCDTTGVEIEMPAAVYHSGDPCGCRVHVCNATGAILAAHPLFVILDVHGQYFFGPSFMQPVDSWINIHPDFAPGETVIEAVQPFTWPGNAAPASGIIWYAALTDPGVNDIIGEWDSFEFGWE